MRGFYPHTPMLTWKSDYETGSPLVDGQHKILFEKINMMEKILAAPVLQKRDVDALVEFLSSYVVQHFKFEEQCMEHHKCPAAAQNKQAHGQLLDVLAKWKEEYQKQGATKELVSKLHATSSAWIHSHIIKVDTQLKPCIKAH